MTTHDCITQQRKFQQSPLLLLSENCESLSEGLTRLWLATFCQLLISKINEVASKKSQVKLDECHGAWPGNRWGAVVPHECGQAGGCCGVSAAGWAGMRYGVWVAGKWYRVWDSWDLCSRLLMRKNGRSNFPEWLGISCWLPHCGKVSSGDCMTTGCCKAIAKHPNHNHVNTGVLQQLEFQGLVISTIFQYHNNFKHSLSEWLLTQGLSVCWK